MDKASLRLSGRVAAHGNGRIGNEKFTLTASTGFANGGTVTLRATPGFSPAYSEESKKLNFQGDSVGDVANISNLSNIDVQFSKGGVELAGQTCDVTVARDHSDEGNANPSGVQIKTNVDKVGDVTITAIQKGHKTLNDEDARSENNAIRIAADIPLSDVNADLTGSVDYDLVSKNANVRIGYHKDDITVKLRTHISQDASDSNKRNAKSTINLDYSGLEGIGVGVEVKDDKKGHLQITKDDFKLKVPIEDNKVNTGNASITYNWSIDM
jgi:hypothetical protein